MIQIAALLGQCLPPVVGSVEATLVEADGIDASDQVFFAACIAPHPMDYDHAEPANAGQLHHVELYASDLETSVNFWDWLLAQLGYELKNEWDSGRSWRNGPTYVVLVQADDTDHPFQRRAAGLNHLAFHAASREQVDEITVAIGEREDATVLYEDRHPFAGGYYALYCEDPEGIKVEVVGPE